MKFKVTQVVQDSGGNRVIHFKADNGDAATLSTSHSPELAYHLVNGQEVEFAVDLPKVKKAKAKKVKKAKKGKK